ncbi:AAA family ATPase [Ligilactobacillus ruminis]|uniref:AAA family ATPase n=1 Tax=Ligilactobacillus ruminis TaxID=1623 RepID=A0AAQ3ASS2_9LACO|nr:AAA family ATPase [Ligilactobacillus ruminis]WDC81359.1 AAA family ATPase [Ligilactobacillus ruminis]
MGFYIKSVEATGPTVKRAVVSLTKGLNIIAGISNKGKTTILQFIEYAFGGLNNDSDISIDPSQTGYNLVKVTVNVDGKNVELTRNLQKNKSTINVSSQYSAIASGEYSALPAATTKPFIGTILMNLIGISSEIKVPANSEYKGQRLTWNTLKPLWFLDEDRVSNTKSVLLPTQGKTAFLAGILYLLNGKKFPTNKEYKAQEKRIVVKNYIVKQLADARLKQKQLRKFPENKIDLQSKISEIEENAKKIDQQIAEKVNQSKKVYSEMLKLSDQLSECQVALNRYGVLKKQYISDIKRLSFIADGEKTFENLEVPFLCPVCNQPIPKDQVDESHIAAAKVELTKVVSLLKDLEQSVTSLEVQQHSLTDRYDTCKKQKDSIDNELGEKYYPSLRKLQNLEKQYRSQIEKQSQAELLDSMMSEWGAKIEEIDGELGPTEPFNPKDKLGNDFYAKMAEIIGDLLNRSNYEGLKSIGFKKSAFDLEINGLPKTKNHGKGYRSYLNSIAVMALSKYINEYGKYKSDLLMIDTPLDGLEEGKERLPKGMQKGIFKLFMERGESNQTIIVENLDHLPDIDFKQNGVNVIRYDNNQGFLYLD